MRIYFFKGIFLFSLAGAISTLAGCGGSSPAAAPTLQSIAVTANSLTIAINATEQFTATGTYSDSSTKDITTSVVWTSDTTSVATVGAATGMVTAVSAGSANIIATSGSVHGQAAITVSPAPAPTLQSIAVTANSLTIAINATEQFTATGTYSDSSTKDITNSVVWTSDNTGAATVSASTGIVTAVSGGSADIIATSGSVHNQATVNVPAAQRTYSGSASVGDFLTLSIDQSNNTISYTNLSNGATGTVAYTTDFNGNTTLNDPAGHLLSLSEVPGFGIVALMNNAGSTGDQLALITSVTQQTLTANSFDGQAFNMLEFRTKGGGVGISAIAIDASSNFSGTEYMPFNILGSSQNGTPNSGFNLLPSFSLAADTTSPSPNYLFLQLPEPPASSGKNYIFGASNGMFLVDSEDGSMIGLPQAASKDFDQSWANTYQLTYYQKTNAYGPDGNSPEAGNVAWGVATLKLDGVGNLILTDSQGDTVLSGLLTPVKDTASLYDGTTTGGPFTEGELGNPCYGLFTFTTVDASSGQTEQVFAAFTGGTVLLSSFSTATSYNPGDDYSYFYGVGMPQSAASSATNAGNSTNPGGSSTAAPPGPWNSLGATVSATAQRLYVGSSTTGDLMTFTIDPSTTPGTLAYYDVTNGIRGTATYTVNGNGSYSVTDPNNDVTGALELPDQALLLSVANTGYATTTPPVLVMAVPQMNLTASDFLGQSYNFIQMENGNDNEHEQIGTTAIDANGKMTGDGYTPWLALPSTNVVSPFSDLDTLNFPTGTYPAPWVAATDTNGSINRGVYLFGYPNSLIFLSNATEGTLIGLPKNPSPGFAATPGGDPITGTYNVLFYRKQVTSIANGTESGPNGTWKGLTETDGASTGLATLTITSGGVATLTDPNNGSPSVSWTGTLKPVSGQSYLYGTGSDGLLTDPCDGLYTMQYSSTSGSGQNQVTQSITVFLGFVPGTTPAVALSTFTYDTNPAVTSNNAYIYRYGMGFWTSATQ